MMPSLSLSSISSASSVPAMIKVDKATSELLVGPDWTMNMQICDICNSDHLMAKEVVKGVKRRLQHKNNRVQLLTLTLLETIVKNCGEYIHRQIAERKILDEMIKIVKKKGDTNVREKILMLMDSWQEAFGGPSGKYSHYYWACDELRRHGARFPQRSHQSAPVITPPVNRQPRVPQPSFSTLNNYSRRLDEAMISEVEGLSISTLESMRNGLELLDDMLQALNPNDRMAVKEEIVVDLVHHCRTNQKKLIQMITTTTDENLLGLGLKMNDLLQNVLAKHDAIASGAPLPDNGKGIRTHDEPVELHNKITEVGDKHPIPSGKSPISVAHVVEDMVDEEGEFALITHRNSRTHSGPSQVGTSGPVEDGASSSGSNNALVLVDAPPPETTTNISKEQDLIDLLSIVLTSDSTSEMPPAPSSASAASTIETSLNSYVVPWAQPQAQQVMESLPLLQNQYQPMQPQPQIGYSQCASAYPLPPWEPTYSHAQSPNLGSNPYAYSTYLGNMNNHASMPIHGTWSCQNINAFQYPQYGNHSMFQNSPTFTTLSPTQANGSSFQHSNSLQNILPMNDNPYSDVKSSNAAALNGSPLVTNGSSCVPSGHKPFVPSYRLFEDLNVLGNSEGKIKNGPYSSASENPN
ncbi:TOM1-like protein 6 [Silene latifolia]|uniref:TOM1-like protein 6 n=1 Tax=Silene latifolia TaxID=37657 RepID=UPI003D776ED9